MSERLSTRIDGYLTESFRKYATGENVVWEMNLALTPEGPQFLLQTWMPGMIFGTYAQTFVGLQDPLHFSQDHADEVVTEIMASLRDAKDRQAGEALAENEVLAEVGGV